MIIRKFIKHSDGSYLFKPTQHLVEYYVISKYHVTYITKFSPVQKSLPFKKCSIFNQQNVCFLKVIDLIRCKCAA